MTFQAIFNATFSPANAHKRENESPRACKVKGRDGTMCFMMPALVPPVTYQDSTDAAGNINLPQETRGEKDAVANP